MLRVRESIKSSKLPYLITIIGNTFPSILFSSSRWRLLHLLPLSWTQFELPQFLRRIISLSVNQEDQCFIVYSTLSLRKNIQLDRLFVYKNQASNSYMFFNKPDEPLFHPLLFFTSIPQIAMINGCSKTQSHPQYIPSPSLHPPSS